MTGVGVGSQYATITAAARIFALVVLASPVAFVRDFDAVVNVVLIAAVWTGATFAESLQRSLTMPALVVETCLISYLVALTLQESLVLLPALVVPFFIGGLARGVRGGIEVLGGEIIILAAGTLPNPKVQFDATLITGLFTWLSVGVGFALIGVLIRRGSAQIRHESPASYRDARALLIQLLELSDDLVEGLDPISIGQHIVALAREEIPLSGVRVHARMPDGSITVLEGESSPDATAEWDSMVDAAFETGTSQRRDSAVAIPVQTDASVVAVLSARLAPGIDVERIGSPDALEAVAKALTPGALQLDAALVFSAVRGSATADERQRLAREMHDGVAQDLASFGYMIDDATAEAESDGQRERLTELRRELTMVVAELRRSVFSLRNEAVSERTLGERIAIMAEHLEARFGVRIEVTVNESDDRLRPEVESELQRIAQEGMNNAVKHARASVIQVRCVVRAPHGQIRVLDDGVGLHEGRDDSHGLRIMRERARRIGADLDLYDTGTGTLLEVTLGTPYTGRHAGPAADLDAVTATETTNVTTSATTIDTDIITDTEIEAASAQLEGSTRS